MDDLTCTVDSLEGVVHTEVEVGSKFVGQVELVVVLFGITSESSRVGRTTQEDGTRCLLSVLGDGVVHAAPIHDGLLGTSAYETDVCLVVVFTGRVVNRIIINGICTFGKDVVGRCGEEFCTGSLRIVRAGSQVELHVSHGVAGDGLIDTDTHLGTEAAEGQCDRLAVVAAGLCHRHEVGDVALREVGSPTLHGESLTCCTKSRSGIDG